MKRLFNFKYPKIFALIILIISAYFIFKNPIINQIVSHLGALSYLGVFVAGILFAFGFTAPFAVGFFIASNPSNIWLAGIVGGIGAMVSDLLIFRFIRFSFKDEFNKIRREKISKKLNKLIKIILNDQIKVYLMYIFAGFLIASPLPDEAGVIMLAGMTKINSRILAILSFILNTIGIMVILMI